MKIDAGLHGGLADAGAVAQQLEASGFDGLQTAEVAHDPFLPLVLAAEKTERIQLMTGIAVAFARNPMLLANVGWDLHEYSGGRFVLGLGSQIKPHITKRFSMPWSRPAARMQEMIEAIRAIWACWNDGEKLDFRGEFYSHTLMTPMFTPGVNPHGNPPIHLAAVGPMMTRVAGRVADGFVSHAFQTADYLRDVTVPALEEGLADAGRSRTEVEISMPLFVVSGTTEEEFDDRKRATKGQIAFYGSTPAYKGVLEHHGWGDLQPELNRLSKQGRWVEMGDVIDDEILSTFAVVGEPHEVPELIRDRFGGLVDRISIGAYA
ncbi:MAG: LLM class F420-dependent oxidoreductase, partial [Actinobacteria bacterium]|nr:LLM class F420-dependent oxidoreductase [Actinomycetota bacterium]NIS31089.1 LLM class F420-dependent oxidoreductase [Actinomycetota bacterium]NIT95474.1 LLM class F420-dependent oxidoreductase [Actinomycetota bacterium]NIU19156.1 LLM class F420-dependent oxidoreductase [Actinomycetota bacterium]NIU66250.1 LLM class F420-dependent oxidoreductase [Actinomycetota bacterium]